MRLFSLILAAVFAFSLVASPVEAGFQRIKSYDGFKLIMGKRLYDGKGNWLRLNRNGSLSGYNKTYGNVSGKWNLKHGSACWVMKMGRVKNSDCVWVSLDGRKVRIVRKKGTGKTQILYWKNEPKKKTTKKKTTKKKTAPKKDPSIVDELKF